MLSLQQLFLFMPHTIKILFPRSRYLFTELFSILNIRKAIFLVFILVMAVTGFGQRAIVRGIVQDEEGQPIENVVVQVLDYNLQTITSDYGQFAIHVPENVDFRLYFQQISHRDTVITMHLKSKESKNITVVLPTIGNRLEQVNIQSKSDNGYIRVNPKLSFQMPSPGGGMESIIKMLPGASSVNELSSQYNVRGGNYDENLIFVNDIQIYRPFLMRNAQQEGMSFVNTDLAGNVVFSAGGFEAKYGDKMSSVLDVQYKEPTQYGGSFSVSMLGASAHAEGRVDSCFSFLIGARFKSNAYLLRSMRMSGDTADYKPTFFDTQMLLKWDINKKFSISLLGNFSRNSYIYQPTNKDTRFGSLQDSKQFLVFYDGQEVDLYENYLAGLTFSYRPSDRTLLKLIISPYYAKESETYDIQGQYWLNDIEPDMGTSTVHVISNRGYGTNLEHARNHITSIVSAADLRGEHKLPAANTLSWGVKAQNEIIHDVIKEWNMNDSSGYTLPIIHTPIGDSVPLDDPSRILTFGENSYLSTSNHLNTMRFTGFIQDQWNIDGDSMTHFSINAGLRFHYWTYNKKEFTVSPRISFIYNPHWKRDWIFSVRTGLYYQPAFYREMRYRDGTLNPDILSQRSFHIVAGAEYNFKLWRRPFKFTAEAYYKYLDHLITYSGYNDAVGYATGLDLKVSGEFIRGLESWFAVSIMDTKEDIQDDFYYDKDGNRIEPGYIPRPTDQRVAFNLFFQDHIPGFPQFRAHLNFVFASGLPVAFEKSEGFQRVRDPKWYRRVDLGFSFMFLEQSRDRMRNKSKFVRSIKNAGVYIEVFNVLGTKNVASYSWVKDIYNQHYAIPNTLTGRLVNVKFAVEF